MIRFDDYPYAQIREAFSTLFGRLALVLMAVLAGAAAGGVTAQRSLAGLVAGLIHLPLSVLYGPGFVILPVTIIFTIIFVRSEWPLWTVCFVSALMWWNMHNTVYALTESPGAKKRIEAQEMFNNGFKDSRKGKS